MLRLWKPFFIVLSGLVLFSLTCSLIQPVGTPIATEEGVDVVSTTEAVSEPAEGAAAESARVTKTINFILGGEIALATASGDQVRLTIPPFALAEDTEISLATLSVPPANPFQQNVFPGLRIEPEGLRLRLPATLTVALAGDVPGPAARLFYLKRPDLALPLWQSQVQGSALSGKITHFSAYTGSAPSRDEAKSQAAAASQMSGEFPSSWQDSLEVNQAMSEWGNGMSNQGMGDDGQAVINEARLRLEKDLACLMDLNCHTPPLDPCGEYQQMLMQYYQQAVLLALDPESAMMDFLYTELQRVLNECTNRYTLEYNHKLRVDEGGFQQEILVTGKVIFNAPMYGVFESGEPLKMEGSGPVDVNITGQMDVDGETCTIQGSGKNHVTISGQLEADEVGNPWMALNVSENWYTSGSMTFTCPEDDYSETKTLPSMPAQEFPLRFQYEDGAKSMAPNLGGMQGEYIWILHILHTW